jgi:hypothetical protein
MFIVPTCFNKESEVDIEESVTPWKEKDTVYFPPKGKISIPSNCIVYGKWKTLHDTRPPSKPTSIISITTIPTNNINIRYQSYKISSVREK